MEGQVTLEIHAEDGSWKVRVLHFKASNLTVMHPPPTVPK